MLVSVSRLVFGVRVGVEVGVGVGVGVGGFVLEFFIVCVCIRGVSLVLPVTVANPCGDVLSAP